MLGVCHGSVHGSTHKGKWSGALKVRLCDCISAFAPGMQVVR